MCEVYAGRTFDLGHDFDRQTWSACESLQEAIAELARIPQSLMPQVSGPEALEFLLSCVSTKQIASAATEATIELVGWLELPLDDAPALIVTSFNEGFIPSSAGADMFLPSRLRSALGVDDNTRRYARNAYAAATLLASWRDTSFVVARCDQDGDPFAPRRLLFAAPPEIVAERALKFFDESPKVQLKRPLAGALVTSSTESAFEVPRPQPLSKPISRMSVTSFKTFLACPYRFYLSRVLKLSRIDDRATELDGASFGGLAHWVLERFARSDACQATDADIIQQELNLLLNQLVRQRFGEHPGAALLVQVEQLRMRLQALAGWQADWAADGWRIEHAELSFTEQPGTLDVDGVPMKLTGRIDRIDLNANTGKRIILDYKTSDAGDSPERTHRTRSGDWIDLQLPLYRHLASELGIRDPVQLGYVLLPKNLANTGLALAEWNDADLADADRLACEVVRKIRNEEFWPPAEPPPLYSEDFAPICMDGVFTKPQSPVIPAEGTTKALAQ